MKQCHSSADMYMQRRFLRARNHDVAKAKAMFMTHMQWRKEFGVDQLDQFVFQERDAMISLYPQGYHKMDKMVSSHHICILILPISPSSSISPLLTEQRASECQGLTVWMLELCKRHQCMTAFALCHAGSTHLHPALRSSQHQEDL